MGGKGDLCNSVCNILNKTKRNQESIMQKKENNITIDHDTCCVDFIYTTFWRRPNYRKQKQTSCQGFCGDNAAVLVLVMVLTVFINTGRNVYSKQQQQRVPYKKPY